MPKVGKKHFSYTKRGKAAARRLAKKTGKKVKKAKKRTRKKRKYYWHHKQTYKKNKLKPMRFAISPR